MKKNNKGFMIVETLIVSTVVLGVLVYMYAQFKSLNNSYNQTFKYNTVENIYKTNEIKKFIESDATGNMITLLKATEKNYLNITECNQDTYNNVTFCKKLYDNLSIKSVLLLSENVTSVINSSLDDFDIGMQRFLKYISNNYSGNYHRIVVEYNDGTYATLRIDILADVYDFSYVGDMQTFTAPIDGYYQIELWGANGSYTKGTIYLAKDTNIYVYVGSVDESKYQSSTDIRLVSGIYDEFNSLKTRIMVAAGEASGYYNETSNIISFISGNDECDSIAEDSTESNILYTGSSIHYSGYKFEYSEIISAGEEMPNYTGGLMIGNNGNGYARIRAISE